MEYTQEPHHLGDDGSVFGGYGSCVCLYPARTGLGLCLFPSGNLSPKLFQGSEKPGDDLWIFYYYSFVTLTTMGYGDILSITKSARALSILEAITGQLYLAIMISRLEGIHASQSGIGKNN